MSQLSKIATLLIFMSFLCSCNLQYRSISNNHNVSTEVASSQAMAYGPVPSRIKLNLLFLHVKAYKKIFLNDIDTNITDQQGNANYSYYIKTAENLIIQLKNSSYDVLDSYSFHLQDWEDKMINVKCTGKNKMTCRIDAIE